MTAGRATMASAGTHRLASAKTTTATATSATTSSSHSTALHTFKPAAIHAQQWSQFVDRCLTQRLDVERFAQYAPLLQRQHPSTPAVLADLFLRPRPWAQAHALAQHRALVSGRGTAAAAASTSTSTSDSGPFPLVCDAYIDPRIPNYLQELLRLGFVDVASVLRALYKYSTSQAAGHGGSDGEAQGQRKRTRTGEDREGHEDDAARAAAVADTDANAVGVEGAGGAMATVAADDDGGDKSGSSGSSQRTRTVKAPCFIWINSYGTEETTFYRLTRAVNQGAAMKSRGEALVVATGMGKWLELFVAVSAAEAPSMAWPANLQAEMESARAAFAMLLLAVCENELVAQELRLASWQDVRRSLAEGLQRFIPLISLSSTAIASRLEHFRVETLAGAELVDRRNEAETSDIHDILDSTVGLQSVVIPELPSTNSCAGLYIYLNAALVGRPLLDDAALFRYLHNRYQGDLQTMAVDLILASFDVLANAVFRSEGQTSAYLLRSYLVNKVPLLLASLAASASALYPFDAPFCISTALGRVDTNAFPTMSSMFDDSQSATPFTDSVRQDFCFACCLHGLIPEAMIETLLGEMTYQSLPAGGRYSKERLVQQCLSVPGGAADQVVALAGQLENMDGNVGAVCQALVEVVGQLCRSSSSKERTTLRVLCNQLVRKPLVLDVMLLFVKPAAILQPLCALLDQRREEGGEGEAGSAEDGLGGGGGLHGRHGGGGSGGGSEYQPLYEDFGAVLLLVQAFVQRYRLSVADLLGVRWTADSFVAKLVSRGHVGRSQAELSEAERESLGNWIRGLFDMEAAGLDDDLMSACPPQQFYLLTPALFQQIVQAFSSGVLAEDVLRHGIEYLVDTFLLPSLVTGLLYLSDALRVVERPNEQRAMIRVLQLILQPASISSEAAMMLSALLNMVAKPLEHALRTYQRHDPKSQDIDPLLKALRLNIPLSRRTGAAEHNELVGWVSHPNGGLTAALRHTFQGFVQWAMQRGGGAGGGNGGGSGGGGGDGSANHGNGNANGSNVMPTSYTHRQFLAGLRLLGAPRLLQLILEEVQQRSSEAGLASVAYDVACALICAPDAATEAVSGESSGGGRADDATTGEEPPAASAPAVQRYMSLRQALAFRAEEWKKMQRSQQPGDVAMAETVVRLYRRVEAQMAPAPAAEAAAAAAAAAADLGGDVTGAAAAAVAALDDAMDMVATAAVGSGSGSAADGMDLASLGGGSGIGTGAGAGGTKSGAASGVGGGLGDLGDLGDLGSLSGLGDMGGTGSVGGSVGGGDGLDFADQSMFGDLDLLNSWIDMQ